MDKEKIYRTNIYRLLKCLEEKINWEEKVYEENVCTNGNSYATGYHAGVVNTLNNTFCAIKDLQTKSFHDKEFYKEEIEEVLNERA